MYSVEEFVSVGYSVGCRCRGRERGSLAFQLREQSVHGIGDGGGTGSRRDRRGSMTSASEVRKVSDHMIYSLCEFH